MQSPQYIPMEKRSIYDIVSRRRRTFILVTLGILCFLLPFADTIYLPAFGEIKEQLRTSDALVTTSVSFFLFMGGFCSLIWGSISDRFGRKISLVIGLVIFVPTSIACVFTTNIIVLILLRGLEGGAGVVVWVVGVSVVADIYPEENRGWAMGIFFLLPCAGPTLGPVVGGPLSDRFGWQSTFILLAILSLLLLTITFLFVPETHHYFVKENLLKTNPTLEINNVATNELLPFQNPWKLLVFLADLNIIPHVILMAVTIFTLYISNVLFSSCLHESPYNYGQQTIGLLFIPTGIVLIVGNFLGGWLSDIASEYYGHERCLTGRLVPGLILSLLTPIGVLIFGWTLQYRVHPIGPIIGFVLLSFGQAAVESTVTAYLTTVKQNQVAAITGVNIFVNLCASGIAMPFSIYIKDTLNIGFFSAVVCLMNAIAIIWSSVLTYKNIQRAKGLDQQNNDTASGFETLPLSSTIPVKNYTGPVGE